MKDTAFIVTKPLQILVALSIIKQLNIQATSHLVIVDSFFNAEMIFERLKLADWEYSNISIEFCNSTKEAYKFVGSIAINNLFIDADVGVRKYMCLLGIKIRRRLKKIFVYEEGLGTYRSDIYSGLKREIIKFFGIGVHFGGSGITNGVYVCCPSEYLENFPKYRKSVEKIRCSPQEILRLYFDKFSCIFDYSPSSGLCGEVCNIYLSNWQIDRKFTEKFSALPGDKYLKPHPHIKAEDLSEYGTLIGRTAPAEMVLIDLMEKYKFVNVFHHGSSVEKYISAKNIAFIRV